MPEISVTLVRKHNIAKDADELMNLEIICLDDLGIEEIDNLEVFDQVKELRLSSNKITVLENLEFLFHLKKLDVSYNEITLDALESGLKRLPKSVTFIDVSGNPCTNDSGALQVLQDRYPAIEVFCNGTRVMNGSKQSHAHRIIDTNERPPIGIASTVTSSSVRSTSKRGASLPSQLQHMRPTVPMVEVDTQILADSTAVRTPGAIAECDDVSSTRFARLDADAIVREIVERKCMRQTAERVLLETLSLSSTNTNTNSSSGREPSAEDVGPEYADEEEKEEKMGQSKRESNPIVDGVTAEADLLGRSVDEMLFQTRAGREDAGRSRLEALDRAAQERRERHTALIRSVRSSDRSHGIGFDQDQVDSKSGIAEKNDSVDVFMQRLRLRADTLRAELRRKNVKDAESKVN